MGLGKPGFGGGVGQPGFGSPSAGPAFFPPNSLAGCDLWLEADQIVPVADGASLPGWVNIKGPGVFVAGTGNGAAQPKYAANYVNGKPAVYFDGLTYFTAGDTAYYGSDPSWTMVYVSKTVRPADGSLVFSKGQYSTAGYYNNDDNFVIGTNHAFATGVFQAWHVTTSEYKQNPNRIFTNGVQNGSDFAATITAAAYNFYVGAYLDYTSPTVNMNGHIALLGRFVPALSTSDRLLLEAWIRTKYGF